jgi:hypothetical protein
MLISMMPILAAVKIGRRGRSDFNQQKGRKMAFELIRNVGGGSSGQTLAPEGARISSRVMGKRGGAVEKTRFIKIEVGAMVAKTIGLSLEKHKVKLLSGTGNDVGKVAISPDNAEGDFPCKRAASGAYVITINERAAMGLFSLVFETIHVDKAEIVRIPSVPHTAVLEVPAMFPKRAERPNGA